MSKCHRSTNYMHFLKLVKTWKILTEGIQTSRFLCAQQILTRLHKHVWSGNLTQWQRAHTRILLHSVSKKRKQSTTDLRWRSTTTVRVPSFHTKLWCKSSRMMWHRCSDVWSFGGGATPATHLRTLRRLRLHPIRPARPSRIAPLLAASRSTGGAHVLLSVPLSGNGADHRC